MNNKTIILGFMLGVLTFIPVFNTVLKHRKPKKVIMNYDDISYGTEKEIWDLWTDNGNFHE